jgi:hypothetical protein
LCEQRTVEFFFLVFGSWIKRIKAMIVLEITDYQAENLQRFLTNLSYGALEKLELDFVIGELSKKTGLSLENIEPVPFQIHYDVLEDGASAFPTLHLS